MVILAVTLILCVLLGFLLLIPGRRKYDLAKEAQSSANDYKVKVYDVTSYVDEHPGGDAILAHAGDDSTEGFYGPQHATRVFDMIDDFYIGELRQ